jgi:hypothetical protein
MHFQNNKTGYNEPVTTGHATTGCPRNTPRKYAHFETILKRNGPEMHVLWPKQYVTAKSEFAEHLIVSFLKCNFYLSP